MLKYTRYKDTIGEFGDDGIYRVYLARTAKKAITINGISWDVWHTDSMWVAEACDGAGLISEETFEQLEIALKAFDPTNPHRDGIAFLPPEATMER